MSTPPVSVAARLLHLSEYPLNEPIVIPPGAGELVGDSPDRRVEILSDHDALHATWSRFGPNREGADLHIHRRHHDLFYVLEGELTVRLGPEDEGVIATEGILSRLPPLVVHGFRNAGSTDVRFLNLHAPGQGFASFMRALSEGHTYAYDQEPPPPDGGISPASAVIGGHELLRDRPGLRVVLLADVDEIGISEVWSARGDPGQPPHVHARHVESFYVLEGELALEVGERRFLAAAGTWMQVPPGIPHRISMPGAEPVRFLDLHTPSCGFGRFRRAREDSEDETLAATRAGFDQQPAP